MSREDRLRIWREEDLVPQLHLLLLTNNEAAAAGNLDEVLATPNPNAYVVELGLGRFLHFRDVHNIPGWVSHAIDLCAVMWKTPRLRGWVCRLYREIFGAIPFDQAWSYDALEVWGLSAQYDDHRIAFGITDIVLAKVDWTRVSPAARARLEAPVFIGEEQFHAWKASNLQ